VSKRDRPAVCFFVHFKQSLFSDAASQLAIPRGLSQQLQNLSQIVRTLQVTWHAALSLAAVHLFNLRILFRQNIFSEKH